MPLSPYSHDAFPSDGPRTPTSASIWSAIDHAQNQDDPKFEEAWIKLVNRYKPLIVSFLRPHFGDRSGDLAQDFMGTEFVRELIPKLEPSLGFRRCLFTSLNSFRVDQVRWGQAKKRGGNVEFVPLEGLESAVQDPNADPNQKESDFDFRFAEYVAGLAIARLQAQFAAEGRADEFQWFFGKDKTMTDKKLSELLSISEAAVRQRRTRHRQRLQICFREVVAEFAAPEDVERQCKEIRDILRSRRRTTGFDPSTFNE